MTSEGHLTALSGHVRSSSWGGPDAWTLLRRIAEDARLRTGFSVSAIEVLRRDGLLELVAFTGRPDYEAVGTGGSFSLGHVQRVLEQGTRYGRFVFLAEEEMDADLREAVQGYGYVPAIPESSDPECWRPLDMLVAHVVDGVGRTRALLHLDEPLDGRRPTPRELQETADSVELALLAVLAIVDREELTRNARIDEVSRIVVRAAAGRLSSSDLLALIHPDLVEGFHAQHLEVLLHDRHPSPLDPAGRAEVLPEGLRGVVSAASHRAWVSGRVIVVDRDRVWGDDELERLHRDELADHLTRLAADELLLVPVGSGHRSIGVLVVVRAATADRWTVGESHAALGVSHDLGRALLSTRAHEREQRLIDELRQLDEYRRHFLATVSHELMNPLAVIGMHVDMLQSDPDLHPHMARSLRAVGRSSARLTALIDNLLMLSRLENPDAPVSRGQVDLVAVLADVAEDEAARAERQGVELRVLSSSDPLLVTGEPEELRRVMVNLVSNAVKYCRASGAVDVSLDVRGDDIVFTCADDGIGISAEDQRLLATEFFRSTNPEARKRPRTGLGLAITARIVARHGGRLDVASELAAGTTVQVILPAAS